MGNLNQQQEKELATLLTSPEHSEKDCNRLIELYILDRRGRSVDINLDSNLPSNNHMAYSLLRSAQTNYMLEAYNIAREWYGINYRGEFN